MSDKARRNYIRAFGNRIGRKKMYKSGKHWVVAGISFLLLAGAGSFALTHNSVHANINSHNVQTADVNQALQNYRQNQSNTSANTNAEAVRNTNRAEQQAQSARINQATNSVNNVNVKKNNVNPQIAVTNVNNNRNKNNQVVNNKHYIQTIKPVSTGDANQSSSYKPSVRPNVKKAEQAVSTYNVKAYAQNLNSAFQAKNPKVAKHYVAKAGKLEVAGKSAGQPEIISPSMPEVGGYENIYSLNHQTPGPSGPYYTGYNTQFDNDSYYWGSASLSMNTDGTLTVSNGTINDNISSPNFAHKWSSTKAGRWTPYSNTGGEDPQPDDYEYSDAQEDGPHYKTGNDFLNELASVATNAGNNSGVRRIVFHDVDVAPGAARSLLDGNQAAVLSNDLQSIKIDGLTIDGSSVDASNMFANLPHLSEIDGLGSLDVSPINSMNGMFAGDKQLNNPNLNSFTTNGCHDFSNMFNGDTSLNTLDLTSLNTNDKPTTGMLSGTNLIHLTLGSNSVLNNAGLNHNILWYNPTNNGQGEITDEFTRTVDDGVSRVGTWTPRADLMIIKYTTNSSNPNSPAVGYQVKQGVPGEYISTKSLNSYPGYYIPTNSDSEVEFSNDIVPVQVTPNGDYYNSLLTNINNAIDKIETYKGTNAVNHETFASTEINDDEGLIKSASTYISGLSAGDAINNADLGSGSSEAALASIVAGDAQNADSYANDEYSDSVNASNSASQASASAEQSAQNSYNSAIASEQASFARAEASASAASASAEQSANNSYALNSGSIKNNAQNIENNAGNISTNKINLTSLSKSADRARTSLNTSIGGASFRANQSAQNLLNSLNGDSGDLNGQITNASANANNSYLAALGKIGHVSSVANNSYNAAITRLNDDSNGISTRISNLSGSTATDDDSLSNSLVSLTTSTSSSINSLSSSTDKARTSLNTSISAVSSSANSEIGSNAKSITADEARMTTDEGWIHHASTHIKNLRKATQNAVSNLHNLINANTSNLDSKIQTNASNINNNHTAIVNDYTALRERIDNVNTTLGHDVDTINDTLNNDYKAIQLNRTLLDKNAQNLNSRITTDDGTLNTRISDSNRKLNGRISDIQGSLITLITNDKRALKENIDAVDGTLNTKIDNDNRHTNDRISNSESKLYTKITNTQNKLESDISDAHHASMQYTLNTARRLKSETWQLVHETRHALDLRINDTNSRMKQYHHEAINEDRVLKNDIGMNKTRIHNLSNREKYDIHFLKDTKVNKTTFRSAVADLKARMKRNKISLTALINTDKHLLRQRIHMNYAKLQSHINTKVGLRRFNAVQRQRDNEINTLQAEIYFLHQVTSGLHQLIANDSSVLARAIQTDDAKINTLNITKADNTQLNHDFQLTQSYAKLLAKYITQVEGRTNNQFSNMANATSKGINGEHDATIREINNERRQENQKINRERRRNNRMFRNVDTNINNSNSYMFHNINHNSHRISWLRHHSESITYTRGANYKYQYFTPERNLWVHTNINFSKNKDNVIATLKPSSHIIARIIGVYTIHGLHHNHVRYEIRLGNGVGYVTGKPGHVRNAFGPSYSYRYRHAHYYNNRTVFGNDYYGNYAVIQTKHACNIYRHANGGFKKAVPRKRNLLVRHIVGHKFELVNGGYITANKASVRVVE